MDKQLLNDEQTLKQHAKQITSQRMQDWFSQDPSRQGRFTINSCGLTLDYSHHLINEDTLILLAQHCDKMELRARLEAMFSGAPVNTTENRPALHTALRDQGSRPLIVNDQNIKAIIQQARLQAESLVDKIHQLGITDLVHIGMGESYWGPLCLSQAFSALPSRYRMHFVATIDPEEISSILATLNPKTTLFILASKSFGTYEMLVNAALATSWLSQRGIQQPEKHFIAITEKREAAQEWGLATDQILPLWDWVGGRFSLWSLISLPIILSYSFEVFDQLLDGAYQMDQHLMNSEWFNNMPVIMAMIEYWYRQYFNFNALAIIPYEYGLRSLIPHLQQLHMESLGKPSRDHTGGIVWGALGSHAQHTFNQLLQQGTEIVPIDFILSQAACAKTPALKNQCLAQRLSLMQGHRSSNPHAILEGNRPSNLILLDSLSPKNLGSLLALYEHKVSILAVLYGINAFDQFGVEYSKELALKAHD